MSCKHHVAFSNPLCAPKNITTNLITANMSCFFFFPISGEAKLEFVDFAEESQPEQLPDEPEQLPDVLLSPEQD